MADYTDRFWDAATALGLRYFEEVGARDIWDELANFNDEDMSITDYIKNVGSLAWQVSNAPMNAAVNLSIETDRLAGAGVLAATGGPREALRNYATAWTPPTPSETEPPEGTELSPGVYHAAALSDLLVIGVDKFVAEGPLGNVGNRFIGGTMMPLGGIGYNLGTIGKPLGPYENGSYASPTYDVRAYDAADLIRDSDLRTAQTITGVATQAVIDPLNWASGPIGAAIAGMSAKRLVTVGGMVNESLTAADLLGAVNKNKAMLRAFQHRPGIGTWNQYNLLQAMKSPEWQKVLTELAKNKDAQWATNFFLRNGMAHGDGAVELGKLSTFIDKPEDMWHLFNAAAYRNVDAVDKLKRIVINNTPLNNSVDTLLGTGDNLFDQVLVDFKIGDKLPDGHILTYPDSKQFLDSALIENPTIQAKWDELAAAEQAKIVTEFGQAATRRKDALEVVDQMFAEGKAKQILEAVPTERALKGIHVGNKTIKSGALEKAGPDWLAWNRTPVIQIPGSHRFGPKFLLLARPGLTFKLHGLDAINKFDDLIRYANGLIGSPAKLGTLADESGEFAYQFALDPEVQKIRAAFLDAAVGTTSPEQVRAKLVNQLQQRALAKIAEAKGFDPEVARMLAEAGMVRADNLNSALISADTGYMSTVNDENGVITVIAGHPSTKTQTANFVPIMDWAGVSKALSSRPMQALTDPNGIVSVAKSDQGLQQLVGEAGKYPIRSRRDLQKVGRVETPVGVLYHGMVDISDTVRRIFTHSVLLRLGYPVRNLAEGTLSTTGSGVGLINVLSKVDFTSLLKNHLSNWKTMPGRQSDHFKSYFGIINNERALEAALRQVNNNIDISTDTVAQMLMLVTNKATTDQLATIIATSKNEELVAEAQASLEYLTTMKLRLAQGIDEAFVVTDEEKELVGVAQRLYHTDLNDTLQYQQDVLDPSLLTVTGKLKRPLSTTPQLPIAQMNVDAQYTKGMFGESVSGQPQWTTRRFSSGDENSPATQWAEAKKRMVELRKTHRIEYRQSPDDPWTPYQHYTKYVPGVTDNFEFRALPREGREPRILAVDTWGKEVDLRNVSWDAQQGEIDKLTEMFPDLDEEILRIAGSGRTLSDMDNVAYLVNPRVEMDGDVFYHGTSSTLKPGDVINPSLEGGSPIKTFDYKTYTGDNRYAFATRDPNYAWEYANTSAAKRQAREHVYVVRPVRGPEDPRPVVSLSDDETRILAGFIGLDSPMDGLEFTKGSLRILTERGKNEAVKRLNDEISSYENAIADVAKGESARRGVAASKKRIKELTAIRDRVQEAKIGNLGGVRGRDGRELSSIEWMDEAIADGWVVVKELPTMTRREARERISEVLAKHGIYRTVWKDSGEWGGVNVLIHPKAIGGRGLFHAVEDDIRERVARAAADAGPDVSAIPKASKTGNQRLRGQMLGKPIHPKHYGKLSKVLEDGGFEKIMEDAVAERIQLVRQKAALQVALDQRMQRTANLTKRRGKSRPNLNIPSRYRPDGHYVAANMLGGHNGYAYANFASADETTGMTISGNLMRQDLANDLRRSFLKPTDIHPADPWYFEGFSNLLGRMYRDLPGAEDMAAIGIKSMDDIDPIVLRALASGDRERLYEEAVDWALNTKEGHDWARALDLAVPGSGSVDEAIARGAKEAAYRGTPKPRSRAKRRETMDRKDWRQSPRGRFAGSSDEEQRVEIGDVIAQQFKFVEDYMPPQVRELFLDGKATADELRKAYEANPWELRPFNGMMSPTSDEYKQARLAAYDERGKVNELTDRLLDGMSTALRAIGSVPETRMLRHPVFETVADLDFRQRIASAENMLGRALSLAEQADLRSASQAYALVKMKETLYTLESRSTLDEYLRFVAPFFPAWVNAASRWGKFYMRNPANPGKIGSRVASIKSNTVLVNENGEPVEADSTSAFDSYLVVPFGAGNLPFTKLSELVNKMWPGAAEVMNKTYIPLRSIDVVFQGQPGNPGFGPWVTVPTQYLLNKRDEWFENDVGKFIIKQVMPIGPTTSGYATMDYVQHFMPTGVRRIVDTLTKNQAWYSAYTKNKLMLVSMQAEGTYDGDPIQMEEDAIELTRFTQFIKIAASFTSPVAQQQRGDVEYYASRWREFRDATGSADEADRMFYEQYPAQWVLSQGISKNLTGGMAQATTTSNQQENQHLAAVASELGAPELMGFADNYQPDGELASYTTEDFNPYSRRWQFYNAPTGAGENYRTNKQVQEVIRDAAVDEGWMKYQQVEAVVEGRLVAQGYTKGSYEFMKAKQERMSKASEKIGQYHPEWALARGEANFAKNERNAIFFRYQINDPKWMEGKEDHTVTRSIREYLNTRDVVRAGMERQGTAKTSTAKSNEQWNAALEWKRQQLSDQSPAFKEWVDRYFRNDIISVDDITFDTYMEAAS